MITLESIVDCYSVLFRGALRRSNLRGVADLNTM